MCPAEDPEPAREPGAAPVVLVVEDEVILRVAIAEHLRDCGFKVAEAGDGLEAQTLILAGLNPDLVFSDVSMPGMDGLALVRWLEENGIDAQVVITSGVQSSLDAARSACTNVRLFISKPYEQDWLAEQFRTLLTPR